MYVDVVEVITSIGYIIIIIIAGKSEFRKWSSKELAERMQYWPLQNNCFEFENTENDFKSWNYFYLL